MVVADLHVHTTNSDGTLAPDADAVAAAAREAGVGAVAVTDHDRLPPGPPERQVDGVTVIAGIELRVAVGTDRTDGDPRRLDLLGYFLRKTDPLAAEVERIQTDRIERAREMIDRIEARTGASLDVDLEAGIGRPHVARAIERSDADYDYQGAFDHLIGADGPCYVARELTGFERGVDLLAGACGLVALAHPLRYGDPHGALACREDEAVLGGRPLDRRGVDRPAVRVSGLDAADPGVPTARERAGRAGGRRARPRPHGRERRPRPRTRPIRALRRRVPRRPGPGGRERLTHGRRRRGCRTRRG
jgi:predicted metal-dependent phosphoesterase TrpH